jgi:hypothetical protein
MGKMSWRNDNGEEGFIAASLVPTRVGKHFETSND